MKNALILLLLAASVFFADRAVRAENQRYALLMRMCEVPLVPNATVMRWDFNCLDQVETHTSWFAHFPYMVFDPAPRVAL